MKSRSWSIALLGAVVVCAFVLLACKRLHPAGSSGATLALEFEGRSKLSLTASKGGFVVTSESKPWAEVRVESDRVKLVRDGVEKAKAKRKDSGFKLYDGNRELVSAKRRGTGYALHDAQDAEIGRTEATTGRIAGVDLALTTEGPQTLVRRGTSVVAKVTGSVKPSAALLLGLTEFAPEQRLVMLIIVNEGIAP